MKYTIKNGVVTDSNNNTATVAYWGSIEAAQASLETLVNCRYCRDCYSCDNCSDCSGCSDCHDCSDCSGCNDCRYCRDCYCCSFCNYCSKCRDCSDCSKCRDCDDCDDCWDCRACYNSRDLYFDKPLDCNVPHIKGLHGLVFAAASKEGALNMRIWSTECGTTMCRAGWIVHVAGQQGLELKDKTSYAFAAQQIAKASGFPVSINRFFDTNEQALQDMEKMAKLEADAEVRP